MLSRSCGFTLSSSANLHPRGLARAGKVKNQTPKVAKAEKKKDGIVFWLLSSGFGLGCRLLFERSGLLPSRRPKAHRIPQDGESLSLQAPEAVKPKEQPPHLSVSLGDWWLWGCNDGAADMENQDDDWSRLMLVIIIYPCELTVCRRCCCCCSCGYCFFLLFCFS